MSRRDHDPLDSAEVFRYHDHLTDQLVTVIPPNAALTVVKPAHLPPKHPHLYLSEQTQIEDHPSSEMSSPDIGASLSASSTHSYPAPQGHLNPSLSPSPDSSPPPKAFALASRVEAGLVENPSSRSHGLYEHRGSQRLMSYAGHTSYISEDNASCSAHQDAPTPVLIHTETKEQCPREREPSAVLLLILLSLPVPLAAIATSLYTAFAIVLVIITSPLRICPPVSFFRSTTSTQLCQLLVPAIHLHERLIHAGDASLENPSEPVNIVYGSGPAPLTSTVSAVRLAMVLLLAPFLCFGLFIAVWTAAFFWLFAMVVGNPDGSDRKDDGRAAVLGVNAWWTSWLSRSRKQVT